MVKSFTGRSKDYHRQAVTAMEQKEYVKAAFCTHGMYTYAFKSILLLSGIYSPIDASLTDLHRAVISLNNITPPAILPIEDMRNWKELPEDTVATEQLIETLNEALELYPSVLGIVRSIERV